MTDRITVTTELAKKLNAKTYVEIGVSKGHAFLAMDCPRKIAVDPFKQMKLSRFLLKDRSLTLTTLWAKNALRRLVTRGWERFFELTSDDFFARVPHIFSEHKIDLAFVDGLHTYRQALNDVLNCARFLDPGGVIVMHDCNPSSPKMALYAESFDEARRQNGPDWDGLWCGDVWKAVVEIRSLHPELEAFVLDFDFGVGIVRKKPAARTLHYTAEDIRRMSYADLESKRAELLDLKPESYFKSFLAGIRPIGA